MADYADKINELSPEYQTIADQIAGRLKGIQWYFSQPQANRESTTRSFIDSVKQGLHDWTEEGGVDINIKVPILSDVQAIGSEAGEFMMIPVHVAQAIAEKGAGAVSKLSKGDEFYFHLSANEINEISYKTAISVQDYDNKNRIINDGLGLGTQIWNYVIAIKDWALDGFSGLTDFSFLDKIQEFADKRNNTSERTSGVELARERGKIIRDKMQEITFGDEGRTVPSEIAQDISQIDKDDKFLGVGSFVDRNNKQLVADIEAARAKENPTLSDRIHTALSGDPVYTSAGLATAVFVSAAAGPPLVRNAVRPFAATAKVTAGVVTGAADSIPGVHVQRNMDINRQVKAMRNADPEFARLHRAYPQLSRQMAAEALEGAAQQTSRAYRFGRGFGKKLPLVGAGIAGYFAIDYYNAIQENTQTTDNPGAELTPEQANELRALLGLDIVAAAGGFLGDAALGTFKEKLLTDPIYDKYLPDTLTESLVKTLEFHEERGTDIERIAEAIENLGDNRIAGRFPLTGRASDTPMHYDLDAATAIVTAWKENANQGDANPYNQNPLIQSLKQQRLLENPAQVNPMQVAVSIYSAADNAFSPIAPEAQFFSDLSRQGPLYQRLFTSGIQSGKNFDEIESNVFATLGGMANHYRGDEFRNLADGRKEQTNRLAMFGPSLFGMHDPVVYQVTPAEAAAYQQREAAVQAMETMLSTHSQRVDSTVEAFQTRFFEETLLSEDGLNQLTMEQLLNAQSQQNTVFTNWLNQSGQARDYFALVNLANQSGATKPTEQVLAILEKYKTYVNQDGWNAYTAQRSQAVAPALELNTQTSDLLLLFKQDPDLVMQTVQLAYMMPEQITEAMDPRMRLIAYDAAAVRNAFEAAKGQSSERLTNEQIALYKTLRQFMDTFNTQGKEIAPQEKARMDAMETALVTPIITINTGPEEIADAEVTEPTPETTATEAVETTTPSTQTTPIPSVLSELPDGVKAELGAAIAAISLIPDSCFGEGAAIRNCSREGGVNAIKQASLLKQHIDISTTEASMENGDRTVTFRNGSKAYLTPEGELTAIPPNATASANTPAAGI